MEHIKVSIEDFKPNIHDFLIEKGFMHTKHTLTNSYRISTKYGDLELLFNYMFIDCLITLFDCNDTEIVNKLELFMPENRDLIQFKKRENFIKMRTRVKKMLKILKK